MSISVKEEEAETIQEETESEVDPWSVTGQVDYQRLIIKFGSSAITDDQIARLERLTGQKAHRFLRRKIFYSERDLDNILDCFERGEKFYLYTGRGPSSEALHLGHTVPFLFTKWLQDVFDCPLVIQLTDDEKFIFKSELMLEEAHR